MNTVAVPESVPDIVLRGHPKEMEAVVDVSPYATLPFRDYIRSQRLIRARTITRIPSIIPIEIWTRVIDQLPLRTMLDLGRTCRDFRELVYRQLPANVRSRYRAFISDVDGLEAVMLHCDAVACGSFVASLISGASHWEPQNLDFVLVGAHKAGKFTDFIKANGYAEAVVPFHPSTMIGDRFAHAYESRRIFHRYSDNAQITVMLCTSSSTSSVLHKFYSTLSFQYITPHYLCCAYPSLTLFDNAILNPNARHGKETNLLWERYDKRGWDHWTWATNAKKYAGERPSRFLCPHKPRFVGDSGCLVVPLTRVDLFTPRIEFLRKNGNLWAHGLRWVVGGAHCPLRCKSRATSSSSEGAAFEIF